MSEYDVVRITTEAEKGNGTPLIEALSAIEASTSGPARYAEKGKLKTQIDQLNEQRRQADPNVPELELNIGSLSDDIKKKSFALQMANDPSKTVLPSHWYVLVGDQLQHIDVARVTEAAENGNGHAVKQELDKLANPFTRITLLLQMDLLNEKRRMTNRQVPDLVPGISDIYGRVTGAPPHHLKAKEVLLPNITQLQVDPQGNGSRDRRTIYYEDSSWLGRRRTTTFFNNDIRHDRNY